MASRKFSSLFPASYRISIFPISTKGRSLSIETLQLSIIFKWPTEILLSKLMIDDIKSSGSLCSLPPSINNIKGCCNENVLEINSTSLKSFSTLSIFLSSCSISVCFNLFARTIRLSYPFLAYRLSICTKRFVLPLPASAANRNNPACAPVQPINSVSAS